MQMQMWVLIQNSLRQARHEVLGQVLGLFSAGLVRLHRFLHKAVGQLEWNLNTKQFHSRIPSPNHAYSPPHTWVFGGHPNCCPNNNTVVPPPFFLHKLPRGRQTLEHAKARWTNGSGLFSGLPPGVTVEDWSCMVEHLRALLPRCPHWFRGQGKHDPAGDKWPV